MNIRCSSKWCVSCRDGYCHDTLVTTGGPKECVNWKAPNKDDELFLDDVKLLLARIEETYGHQVWFQEPRTDLEEAALKIHKHLVASTQEENAGEWQKTFVSKLTDQGVSHEHAMLAMALTCEERQKAYMQGYDKGSRGV